MRLDFGGDRPSAPSNSAAAPPRRFSSFVTGLAGSFDEVSGTLEKSSVEIPSRDGVEREFFIPVSINVTE